VAAADAPSSFDYIYALDAPIASKDRVDRNGASTARTASSC